MKVRVAFTVEVDPDKWVAEFGLLKSEVRADVNAYARNALLTYIADQGLGREKP